MPELPEVQTVVQALNVSGIIGHTIKDVKIFYPKLVSKDFVKKVKNKRITAITRRGKYIILHLNSSAIVVHLKMSGHFLHSPKDIIEKHIHLYFLLDNKERLFFHDVRKFGRFYLVDNLETFFQNIGPEPLSKAFTEKQFLERVDNRKKIIKALLLDQSFVAGIGNIYSDEILWLAKIHPKRRANSLNKAELKRLFLAIKAVLRKGIKNQGTTLGSSSSNFFSIDRRIGGNQNFLKIYGRKNLPCMRCKTKIEKIRVNQRGTYFCPKCQLLFSP